jgi:adenylate cyclase
LGVRYVLEGSVRRAGNRVRITAQLIEGATGNHLWAERYDRELQDIFAVQDEITQMVVGAIGPELSRAEQQRARLKSPNSLRAWDRYQHGLWYLWRLGPTDIQEAIRFFKSSIELDPAFSSAFATLSYAHITNYIRGYTESRQTELQAAYDAAMQAIALDKDDALSHWAVGIVCLFKREHTLALEKLSAAMELNPSYAPAFSQYGLELTFCGRANEAAPYFDLAERISPKDHFRWFAWFGRAWAHFFLGQFDEAAACARKTLEATPSFVWGYVILVAALSSSNQPKEATLALQDLLKVMNGFSIRFVDETGPFDGPRRATLIDALRKAGVPE